MQELKEEFRKIYETSENPTEGLLSISEWLAKSSSVFTKSCQTIRNWFGEIISYTLDVHNLRFIKLLKS
ncbi:hypothetical protein MiTe_04646 [Microcystis aeruginosa NIES-2520]|jgi:transposase|uniref:Transposase IS204/IS1001/IS1096/IS1165 DDE domain-containing protein n=1 Tax=Microcystis aeruginosa NIES-2520 TaxID=2303982 RepID=A0A5A5RSK2_MICAE|nr:hypothetical protein MiTe_04646 [Microcystis aeruginosa NIES-2520]